MRRVFGIAGAIALAAFAVHAGAAVAAGELTGKMAAFGYLLGAPWACTTSVPAMGSEPAHTDRGTATFDVAPGNVAHNHVATPTYAGDAYYGYSDRQSTYWEVDADNMGVHAFLTSADGKAYSGTSAMGPLSMQETTTYAKLAPNKISVHEVLTGPEPSLTIDSVCTR